MVKLRRYKVVDWDIQVCRTDGGWLNDKTIMIMTVEWAHDWNTRESESSKRRNMSNSELHCALHVQL